MTLIHLFPIDLTLIDVSSVKCSQRNHQREMTKTQNLPNNVLYQLECGA